MLDSKNTGNAVQGAILRARRPFIRAIVIGTTICALLIGWSSYNKRIGEPFFQLNTRLEYVLILSPPLLMCATIGSFLDYRRTRKIGLLLVVVAGLGASLAAFLFAAWASGIAAGTR